MRFNTFLPSCGILLVMIGLVAGCSTGPSEEELALQQLQAQFAEISTAYTAVTEQRSQIAAAKALVEEIEAVAERSRTDEQKQQLEEATAKITELQSAIDEGYEALQEQLAAFLNTALNDHQQAAETMEGLAIYAKEAIVNAEDTVNKSGDYTKALDTLSNAKSYYEFIQAEPLPALVEKMTELEDIRHMTRERYDQIKNGMTGDEVQAIAGVVYYQNVRENPNGTVSWLYKRRDGGVAAITFDKKGKVYHRDFDAVKPKVVQE